MSPSPVSSTPVLRAAIRWSVIATLVIAIVGGAIGFLVAGADGLWSALAGALVAAVFLILTSVSVLVANRWFGDPLYVQIFFGIVLGGWFLKLIVFIGALFLLRGQPWLEPVVFFVAIVASVVASLVVDVIVVRTMRIPHVSDVALPGEDAPDADAR
ncbi:MULTISPECIES: hypothetical protein [Microbacterium]|uniref:hypothetical protein n=1 Tax=Microbacterium TaxID=33882 RepID=UPI0024AFBC16|nr:hypothetical protein [Microbacterium barkeri]MDI6942508.1 hypothetical protein [Microbacterium barkeri]